MANSIDEMPEGCGTNLSRLMSESKTVATSGRLSGNGCKFGVVLAYGWRAAPSSGMNGLFLDPSASRYWYWPTSIAGGLGMSSQRTRTGWETER